MRHRHLPLALVASVVLGGLVLAQQPVAPGPGGAPGGRGRGGAGRGGVQIEAGQECPPGMTEVRPRNCQAPGLPAPSIVDYRPESTLVTPTHLVPKARFPVIDYHGHVANMLTSADGVAGLMKDLDGLNVRMSVSADNLSGARLQSAIATVNATPSKDRVRMLTGINFQNVGPGWAEKAIQQLEADVKAGAVGVGEISKSLGLTIKKADGSRLKIDDPDLDPVWAACARLNIPVFIHTADPPEFFQPMDLHNERWLELSLFTDRRWMGAEYPKFEELMAERDRMFRKHPKTRFVAAHLAWYGNDLARLGRLFDEAPNVTAEVGAVLYDLGRQPRGAHDFFVKYQDRLLFGKDSFQPEEFPYYWRVFETADEYFDYYRNYHAFWKLYGMDLPDAVLKKLYYKNALRITPGLPQTGWPQ